MRIKTTVHKLLLFIIIIISIASLYGCARKVQPQRKPVNNSSGQEVKIAVSFADMERDGNQIIKNTMSARQGGQQNGQQGGQQNNQQGGQQNNQQAGLDVVPVQAGQNGAQGQGEQGGQQGNQGQFKVNITWLDAKNNSSQQEKDIDQLLSQDVKAVILQPVDPAAGSRIARKLAQANIKVIALETLPADSPVDGYIATDHARTGELQARYLISAAQGRAAPLKTVILQGDKNDRVSTDIVSSILQYLKGQSQVQVVLVKDHPRGDPQMAASTLEQVLASTGGGIDAVVATDSRMAAAAADLLKNRGLSERVITVGAGADQKSSRALMAGDHDAEVDVMPELIAQYAYDAAVGLATTGYWQNDSRIRNGDFDVPAKTTPVRLITRSESYLLEQRWGQAQGQAQGQNGRQNGQQGDQQNGQNSQDSQSGGQNQGSGGVSAGKKTMLRVTTQDGKTVEVQINGEIKKIETIDGGGAGNQGGGGGNGGNQGSGGGNGGNQGGSGS